MDDIISEPLNKLPTYYIKKFKWYFTLYLQNLIDNKCDYTVRHITTLFLHVSMVLSLSFGIKEEKLMDTISSLVHKIETGHQKYTNYMCIAHTIKDIQRNIYIDNMFAVLQNIKIPNNENDKKVMFLIELFLFIPIYCCIFLFNRKWNIFIYFS